MIHPRASMCPNFVLGFCAPAPCSPCRTRSFQGSPGRSRGTPALLGGGSWRLLLGRLTHAQPLAETSFCVERISRRRHAHPSDRRSESTDARTHARVDRVRSGRRHPSRVLIDRTRRGKSVEPGTRGWGTSSGSASVRRDKLNCTSTCNLSNGSRDRPDADR